MTHAVTNQPPPLEIAESLAVSTEAVLVAESDPTIADAFIASRIAHRHGPLYGTLPPGIEIDDLLR